LEEFQDYITLKRFIGTVGLFHN